MAEWLAARGHKVRAVVGAPFYPHWKIAEGYSGARYRRETVRGVDVMRCPIYVPARQSGLKRLLQHVTLMVTSAPVLLAWAWRWKPDIVWTMMPPLAGLPVALACAKLAAAPSWLHVQDFEVDAAFELGMFRSPRLRRLLLWAERKLLSGFQVVSSITPRMVDMLTAKQVAARKVLFPNWVDLSAIFPLPRDASLRDAFGIPQGAFVGLYSGNLGEKQGVDDLLAVARLLSDVPEFTMVICGDGGGRQRLAGLAGDLANIRFFPLQPIEKFNALLNSADVHLLPQKAEVADLVMPSKLAGMLASGKPVIAGAHAHTQLAQEVEGCGLVVPPGDTQAMAAAVRSLLAAPQLQASLGAAAALRARERWSKDEILLRFETQLVAEARQPMP
jgi:colanic acid biosynthesis glycosyl transferase WcaI